MSELARILEQTEERFISLASPLKFEAEQGFAIQLIKNNAKLKAAATANPIYLQQALTNVAAIGLSLNPAKKQAYLITRNVKTKDDKGKDKWEQRIYLEPSYMGLCDIATSTGRIEWVQAEVVHDKDNFSFKGVGEKPEHTFNAFRDRGAIIGVYCVAKTNGGDFLVDHMDLVKLESVKGRSESIKYAREHNKAEFGPWVTDFEEMAKKSVIRQAFKTWPKTGMERMENAVKLSNDNEGFEPILTSPEIGGITPERKEFFDSLISSSNALEMASFRASCSESEFVALYHSFNKGEKGKYQKIIDGLLVSGLDEAKSIAGDIERLTKSLDDVGLSEIVSGLSDSEIEFVSQFLGEDEITFVSEVR